MNIKTAKKVRREIKKNRMDVVRMFNALRRWPLRKRVNLAWLLLKGLPPEYPHTATMNTRGEEVKD